MKVMYFIHSLLVGGAETICTKYLLELKARKIDVVLVVIYRTGSFLEKRLQHNDVKIISICPLISSDYINEKINGIYHRLISLNSWWRKVIDLEKPDIIHIHTMSVKFFEPGDFPTSRIIYTFHGKVERYLSLMNNKAREKIQKYSDNGMEFFALSPEMSSDIKKMLSTDKVVYIPNAVEIDKIKREAYKREDFLSTLNIPCNSFVLGHVARFHEVKNQKRTVGIFKEVLKIRPDSFLIFVGDYKNKCGDNIKELVKKEGLIDKVRFLGTREDATRIMAVFDSMVLPSFTESFSLVMIEAQVHKVRSIASMTVPKSVICNKNCFRLSLDDSDEKWAIYITSNFEEEHCYKLSDFDLKFVVGKMIVEYKKIV